MVWAGETVSEGRKERTRGEEEMNLNVSSTVLSVT